MQVILSWQLLHCEGQVEPDGEVPGQADETTMTRSINSASLRGIINISIYVYNADGDNLSPLLAYCKEFHIYIFLPELTNLFARDKSTPEFVFYLVLHDQIAR